MLVQKARHTLINYYKMLFSPLFIHQKNIQERVDMVMKVNSIIEHLFMKGIQNTSYLHKIACSLVSLFLSYIMEVVATSKVFAVLTHIIPSFL